ncbi:hypothetical protein NM208_g5442 [Fusarium decemcellulare]|uniref:Uncharacterized protein n=1 Tax=Fusarium decemcellulare TaxID=57161 RepID=A0ACC1SHC1_9HYPO|nr:hypothetical protein NM208_g5442 [Fusarium decemcellulare]
MSIIPFTINVPDQALARLRDRLESTSLPPSSPLLDDWKYGPPISTVERLVKHWRTRYDWRATERRLNKLPQFMTSVDVVGFGSVDLHFVHVKSGNARSVPLLFCHGWPGSFIEAEKLLPLLVNGENGLVFDVVVPSLPNFGFSPGIDTAGFRPPQYAEALHNLMAKLGYDKYVTQGGDFGFPITRYIGLQYPKHCLASHLNFMWANPPSILKNPVQFFRSLLPLSQEERAGLERSASFARDYTGYSSLQSNTPATIGIALSDSPIALLTWTWEKLHNWTDDYRWTDDEILDWVSIYQFSTAGAHANVQIYYERDHPAPLTEYIQWIPSVQLGISYFPKDVALPPMCWGRTLGPVVFDKWHKRGGHFPAHEVPAELAADIRETIRRVPKLVDACQEANSRST